VSDLLNVTVFLEISYASKKTPLEQCFHVLVVMLTNTSFVNIVGHSTNNISK